jgi:ribosome maturation factor RimP
VGERPPFFGPSYGFLRKIQRKRMSDQELQQIQQTVEDRLRETKPDVELLSLEQVAAERLLLVIDHPDGVDLELCQEVTKLLPDLNEDWSLEVSSPGPERPLTKPEHFAEFVGHRVRVKTHEEIGGSRNFIGQLDDTDGERITVLVDGSPVTIPLTAIRRSHLSEEVAA